MHVKHSHNVNAKNVGSVDDVPAYHKSPWCRNVENRHWLADHSKNVNGTDVCPYLVGEVTSVLDVTRLKCA